MTRLAQLTFALLVGATFGAFFVTQRLKRAPLVVRERTVTDAFSPNGDGRRERASIRIQLKRADDLTLSIVDREGTVVRRLVGDRRVPGRRPLQFYWNGRDQRHRVVPDGVYRVRVGLREEGRTVTLKREITVDTKPPRPVVTIVAPGGTGAARFPSPGVGAVVVRTPLPLFVAPRFQVYRAGPAAPRFVAQFDGDRATGTGRWNGRIGGRPAPPGSYFIVVRTIDRVSNLGVSPPLGPVGPAGRGRPYLLVSYPRPARMKR